MLPSDDAAVNALVDVDRIVPCTAHQRWWYTTNATHRGMTEDQYRYVACVGAVVLGTIAMHSAPWGSDHADSRYAVVHTLAVAKDFRRRGIGTALVRYAHFVAFRHLLCTTVHMSPEIPAVVAFYHACGIPTLRGDVQNWAWFANPFPEEYSECPSCALLHCPSPRAPPNEKRVGHEPCGMVHGVDHEWSEHVVHIKEQVLGNDRPSHRPEQNICARTRRPHIA